MTNQYEQGALGSLPLGVCVQYNGKGRRGSHHENVAFLFYPWGCAAQVPEEQKAAVSHFLEWANPD